VLWPEARRPDPGPDDRRHHPVPQSLINVRFLPAMTGSPIPPCRPRRLPWKQNWASAAACCCVLPAPNR
jgi:hypothetical protein